MKSPSINQIIYQLKERQTHELTYFSGILRDSFEKVEPVFSKQKYADFFWHCASTVPGWISSCVLANADAESEGSKKLLDLWQTTQINRDVEAEILYHAKDEARHSHLFVKLVSVAFPDNASVLELENIKSGLTKVKKEDLVKSSLYSVDEYELMDHLVQMNMGEIRTLIHMHFLGPIIYACTPRENKDDVAEILQGLANDEIVHISYTSRIIDDWCKNSGNEKLISRLYHQRLTDFHKLTLKQTEHTVNMYGQNKYPELLEI